MTQFQSTLSVRRATAFTRIVRDWKGISIHALREESDTRIGSEWSETSPFQSTLSVRRATEPGADEPIVAAISIHALREESDAFLTYSKPTRIISIHALREESDYLFDPMNRQYLFQSTLSVRRATQYNVKCNGTQKFQSTLSVRRATTLDCKSARKRAVSIHALREESD